jgi:hypothetical protein
MSTRKQAHPNLVRVGRFTVPLAANERVRHGSTILQDVYVKGLPRYRGDDKTVYMDHGYDSSRGPDLIGVHKVEYLDPGKPIVFELKGEVYCEVQRSYSGRTLEVRMHDHTLNEYMGLMYNASNHVLIGPARWSVEEG